MFLAIVIPSRVPTFFATLNYLTFPQHFLPFQTTFNICHVMLKMFAYKIKNPIFSFAVNVSLFQCKQLSAPSFTVHWYNIDTV